MCKRGILLKSCSRLSLTFLTRAIEFAFIVFKLVKKFSLAKVLGCQSNFPLPKEVCYNLQLYSVFLF